MLSGCSDALGANWFEIVTIRLAVISTAATTGVQSNGSQHSKSANRSPVDSGAR